MSDPRNHVVLVRGAGDLASGVAMRLHRAGFAIVMTELPEPLMVRRAVCFGEAVWEGAVTVEDITAVHVADLTAAYDTLAARQIPVLVDPAGLCRTELAPGIVVDAIMAKRNTGTAITDAPLVVALGPGFTAGVDCHAVIETHCGHWLGRVYWQGAALPDTGVPGEIGGEAARRVLRTPSGGIFTGRAAIGDPVETGQLLGTVDETPLIATCNGILRGLIRSGVYVAAGVKIGDIDPRAERGHCFTVSDKSLAVGGGVLEASLTFFPRQV
jgi:xanthine dehydrogenase accessory factor